MTAVEKFKTDLANWFEKYGFGKLDITFDRDFALNVHEYHPILVIGVQSYPEVSRYFEQFLYEYGLEYIGIFDPVLAFLHELGHRMTLDTFSETELKLFQITKEFSHEESEYDWYNSYWHIPDEFAANIWEINFINNFPEAAEELCMIYMNNWNEIFKDITIEDFLKEVA